MREAHRPTLPGPALFASQPGGADPAELMAAGHRVAEALVRGRGRDAALVERVLHLADTEGLGTLAVLWAHAPADTLPGALWRLYLLRTWVHREPARAVREFTAGRAHAPVDEALAGVVDPPSPRDVAGLLDTVVSGLVGPDLDVTLDRAAAFAHVTAVGRAHLDSGDPHSAARLFDLARQLREAARLERAHALQ